MIMMRTLHRDISKYNQLETAEEAQEETGWKLVGGGGGGSLKRGAGWGKPHLEQGGWDSVKASCGLHGGSWGQQLSRRTHRQAGGDWGAGGCGLRRCPC